MYIVIEIQNGAALPAIVKESREEAESAYHMILAAAAISEVEEHTAIMFTGRGLVLESKCYLHPVEAEAE